ncbi:MAG: hypothetical protein OXK17_10170 [Thaumarchaeota archaeon]|nr:hypothetical protein [Nitrososphaerota archaeon]
MGDPKCGGQTVLKRCTRHGRKYMSNLCPQCMPSCIGERPPDVRTAHEWKKTPHKNQKLKCAKCGAIVVVRGVMFDITRLPRGLVSEKLPACRPGRVHEWDVLDNKDSSFTIRCMHCDLCIRIDGFGFEINGGRGA